MVFRLTYLLEHLFIEQSSDFLEIPTLDVPPYKIGCPALEDPQIQGVGGEEEEINGVEIYKIPAMCKDLAKAK